MGKCTFNSTYP